MRASFEAGLTGALAGCVALLAVAAAVAAAPGDSLYQRPGRLAPTTAGPRLNIYCTGGGAPTVVLDAGHQDWAPAWATVQPQIAAWTRVCSYDRAGSGFSDPGPTPRTSERIAEELHSALQNAGVGGPYILVGHAFGGLNMRAFAYRYLPEVAGLVLVETDTGDVDPPEVVENEHRVFIRQAAELRTCRDAVAKAAGQPPGDTSPGPPDLACDQRFFRGFPEAAWSSGLSAQLLRTARTRADLYDAVVAELEAMPGDETYLQQHRQSLGSRPVRILTAASHYSDNPNTPSAAHLRHLKVEAEVASAQARFLELSSNAKQTFVYQSRDRYLQFEQPDLVVAAIREVFDQSRAAAGGH